MFIKLTPAIPVIRIVVEDVFTDEGRRTNNIKNVEKNKKAFSFSKVNNMG